MQFLAVEIILLFSPLTVNGLEKARGSTQACSFIKLTKLAQNFKLV